MSTTTMPDGCPYCGGYHTTICPRVAEIEYHPNGTVKRVRLSTDKPGVVYGVRDGSTTWPSGITATLSPPPTTTLPVNTIWGGVRS